MLDYSLLSQTSHDCVLRAVKQQWYISCTAIFVQTLPAVISSQLWEEVWKQIIIENQKLQMEKIINNKQESWKFPAGQTTLVGSVVWQRFFDLKFNYFPFPYGWPDLLSISSLFSFYFRFSVAHSFYLWHCCGMFLFLEKDLSTNEPSTKPFLACLHYFYNLSNFLIQGKIIRDLPPSWKHLQGQYFVRKALNDEVLQHVKSLLQHLVQLWHQFHEICICNPRSPLCSKTLSRILEFTVVSSYNSEWSYLQWLQRHH